MYEVLHGGTILRTPDMTYIPPDPDNADYAAYLAWLESQPPKEKG